ncbi:WD40-repeat-containing domain protein [Sphaerosporella brunnea]|uniref:Mitochondrial division protein 1 n=1 Tax=Sphaerosporella brunnea TaxID=1250544 RepID=A0A5J5EQE2_9PEZI|nr:WD40-repeat-containing domain protein [Sphaerosporella brunnea]
MDGSSAQAEPPHPPPTERRPAAGEPEPALGTAIGRDLTAFSRTVTATAGHLIGPFAEPGGGHANHYTVTMGDISKQLAKRPSIQKRMLSFNHRSPGELVRSKLSTAEIQHRALTHVPDEMLANIPPVEHAYSLFQGFQATVPDETFAATERGRTRHRRRSSGKHKALEGLNGSTPDGPPTLAQMGREKAALTRQLEMLGIRKHMSSAEIREIDMKIANLNRMRNIVFDRLAQLEQEESEIEHEIVAVENKIEELEDELALAGIGENNMHQTDPSSAEDTPGEDGSFMSESIYNKIPGKHPRKRKTNRKLSKPMLHEHLEPGAAIKDMQTHSDTITCLDFDVPFGTMVTAALDDTVGVWDLNSGKCLGMLEGHHASVRCLQVEDNIVATGSADASIKLWDLSKAESYRYQTTADDEEKGSKHIAPSMAECHILTLDSHIDEVTALYFQGDMLVSGSEDKTLRQWDLEKGRCVQTLDVLWAAAQSSMDEGKWRTPGGRTANGDFVGALQCFDAALACGTADGMVRLWDLRSGQVHRSLVGHTGPVTALQFDDVHLVTGSLDRSIRIWDLRTGTIFDAFGYDHPVTSMQFDARRIVSACGENVVKIYDKTDGRHWDCGAGLKDDNPMPASIIDRVRIKDGYLVEGRRDGMVGVWAC